MTFLDAVILQCLHKINGERTIYSIFHLLTGKKSSQTIQDAHLYQMGHFFDTLPRLSRQQFNEYIRRLNQNGFISFKDDPSICLVTNKGVDAYQSQFSTHSYPAYLHGWKYQDAAIHLWRRMGLFIQAVSHLNQSVNRYYPIERDRHVISWVRTKILNYKGNRLQLSNRLYKELHAILSHEGFPEDPSVIVGRFSGLNMIGLTNKQIAESINLEETECHFRFLNSLHFIIQTVYEENSKYPLIYSFFSDIYQQTPFTASTLRTYNLLQQNMNVQQIANIRSLKESTIEDHIIEIALSDKNFNIKSFIDQETANEITQLATKLNNRKLKPLKEHFSELSYFQIRLALTKTGVNQ